MNTFFVTARTLRNPLSEFHREMNQLFNDWNRPATTTDADWDWSPACDVEENESHYLMTLEIPGIPKDQIKIEFQDNQLTISGERNREIRQGETASRYNERRFGRFQRSFTLPAGINAEKVEANYQDGVLRLYLPKAESAKPRQISIN